MTSPGGVALAGAVALDVEPDARSFYPRLRAQVLPAADAVGRDIGQQMAAPIVAHVAKSTGDGVQQSARPAQQSARRAGENIGQAMGRAVRDRVRAALSTIPDVDINADSSSIERKVANIRRQLVELSEQRIETDIDEEKALAKIQLLRNRLSGLAREVEKVREAGGDIPLDVDVLAAGAAVTRLKTDLQEMRREADREIKIQAKADAAAAKAELAAVNAEASRLDGRRATVNVDADTGGAIAQLAAMTAASFAATGGMQILLSVGALIGPLIVPAAAAAAAGLVAIGPAALVGAAGVGVLVLALSGVVGAVMALNQQQQQAGQVAAQAAAGQARIAAAAEQERAAVDRLSDAHKDARRAREDLTRAQEEARRAQEDLNISVREGRLSQRAAALDLIEARQRLADTTADPRASEMEQARAQLAYDQAAQRVESLAVRQKRAEQEQAAANKAGIEGSRQVLAARERIAAADERVVAAQRALVNAQRAVTQAHQQSGQAGVAAANKVSEAMGKLSPQGREFARFLVSIKDEFLGLRQAAEAGILPGLQDGIKAFLPMLPQVETFISRVSKAVGDLFRRAGTALTDPFWQEFFDLLGQFAGPALESLGTILGQTAKGFAGLFKAFLPLSEKMLSGLAEMATGFAEWAAELSTSEGFQRFVDYAIENGPMLLGLLGDLVILIINLGIAFAPLGAILLEGLAALVGWLAGLDPAVLAGITAAVLGIAAAIALAAGGPITLLIAAVVAIGAALIYAWQRFEGFRTVVLAVVDAVATAAVWLWRNVLEPAFTAWWGFAQTMAGVYMWLWNNAVKPAFEGIAAVAMWLWDNVLQPAFAAMRFVVLEVLAPAFLFLWRNVISPAFRGAQIAVSIAWAAIQVVFGLVQIGLKALGSIFTWLYRNIIQPVWRGISSTVSQIWETRIRPILQVFGLFIRDHVVPAFKRGVSAIEAAWNRVQEVAKVPIRFVVNTVLNNGLLAAYNKIAKMFGVKPDDVQIPLPAGFATGGHVSGMGGPTSDSVAARLSAGEYVIPTHIVRRFGVGFFDWLIGKAVPSSRKAVRPGDGSEGLAFAKGGLFGGLEDRWNKMADPIGWVQGKVNGLIDKIPGASSLRDVVVGFARSTLGNVINFVKEKITNTFTGTYSGPVSEDVAGVQSWIRRQHGKPYVWAGVGPDGYDCSGMVGAAYNLMHGRQPHRRVFSTHNEAQFFPKPGRGVMTAGWAHAGERGGGRVGHTAANLAGLAFESRGSDGVVVGDRATGVDRFARMGTFDTGGWLLPGLTVAHNGTGEPERILTGPQWDAVQARLNRTEQGGPLIGSLTLAPSSEAVRDQMDEVAFALRRLRRGGVYA